MATTTNFGWTTPNDTDLVKDGAAAIRTLGQSIDTSMMDLKGGTTGQVLAKNSGTDMDFVWSTDATGIPATILDAKGDIIAATAADTASRLAVGANNTVLTADSTAATGLKWATPSSSNANFTLLNAGGTALTGATTVTVSGLSGNQKLLIYVDNGSAGASAAFNLRFNSDSTTKYDALGRYFQSTTVNDGEGGSSAPSLGAFELGRQGSSATNVLFAYALVDGANATGLKTIISHSYANGTNYLVYTHQGTYVGTSVISSISIISGSGNLDGGTVFVYGSGA